MSKKKVTNEDIMKELKKFAEKHTQKQVPYTPIVVSPPCHGHCHCWECQAIRPIHVIPFQNPVWSITSGVGDINATTNVLSIGIKSNIC